MIYVYHVHAMCSASDGSKVVNHFDGIVSSHQLITADAYQVFRDSVAERMGHPKEDSSGLVICSLTLLHREEEPSSLVIQ